MCVVLPVITTNVGILRDVEHQMCGGNLDFVAEVMLSAKVILVKESDPFESTACLIRVGRHGGACVGGDISSALLSRVTHSDFQFSVLQTLGSENFYNFLGVCSDSVVETSITRKIGHNWPCQTAGGVQTFRRRSAGILPTHMSVRRNAGATIPTHHSS